MYILFFILLTFFSNSLTKIILYFVLRYLLQEKSISLTYFQELG